MDLTDPETKLSRKYEDLRNFVLELQRNDVAKKLFIRPRGSNGMDVFWVAPLECKEEESAEWPEYVNAEAAAQDGWSNNLDAFQSRGPIQYYLSQGIVASEGIVHQHGQHASCKMYEMPTQRPHPGSVRQQQPKEQRIKRKRQERMEEQRQRQGQVRRQEQPREHELLRQGRSSRLSSIRLGAA